MRKILTSLLMVLVTFSCTNKNDENLYDLNWKLKKGEVIEYKTIMQVVEQSDTSLNELFKEIDSFESQDYSFFKDEMNKINKDLQNTKMISLLLKDNKNIIQIKMLAEFENTDDQEDKSLFKKIIDLNDGVMLRGALNPNGSIQSFWLKSGQKNLISMLFELPSEPIHIGDKWEMDINFIGNDQSFICKHGYKINEGKLLDVISKDGKDIALLKYKIIEFVNGDFNNPIVKAGKSTDLKMTFIYEALAEFSITDGRWVKYEGILTQKMSGYMDSSSTQKISLIPE